MMASNDNQSFDVVKLLSLFASKTMLGSSKAISLKTRHKDTYTQWHSADDKENKKTWQVNMNMKTWQVNMNMKTWQVKQDLWKVWPAALIISAMKTVFPHLGSPLLLLLLLLTRWWTISPWADICPSPFRLWLWSSWPRSLGSLKKRMQNISVCLYFSLPTVTLFVELFGTSGFLGAI